MPSGNRHSQLRYRVSGTLSLSMNVDRLGNLRSRNVEGVRHSETTRFTASNWGSDFGDHRATRALCAPRRLPVCAAVSPLRPWSRIPASLHVGVLAFGVPPRTERPPQAGRGMGMPRPALVTRLRSGAPSSALSRTGSAVAQAARHARVCRTELRRGRIDRFDIPGAPRVRGITTRAVHRRRESAGT